MNIEMDEEQLAELLKYYSPDKSRVFLENVKQKEVLANGESKQVSNLDYLRGFCEDDEQRIKKYVDLYSQSAPQNIEKIKSFLKNDDFTNVKLIIHSMKPHFTFMGMDKTRVLAEEIEDLISQNEDKKILVNHINELEELTNLSLEELNYKLS